MGISSIRPAYPMAWTFCPGRIRISSRMAFGITTWYFVETVTVSMADTSVQR